jgi:hypothetical protein
MAGKASGLFHPHGATPKSIRSMTAFLRAGALLKSFHREADSRSSCRGIDVPIARAQQKTALKANPGK